MTNPKSKIAFLLSTCLLLTLTAWQRLPTPPSWQWQRAETGLRREAIMLAVAAHPRGVDEHQLADDRVETVVVARHVLE